MRRVEEIWGTVISVDVRDQITPDVLDECFAWFRRVDDLFSTWRDDTEIMRLGRGDLRIADVSPEVRSVLQICEQMRRESEGAFDIAFALRSDLSGRPGVGPLDPSGFVKGWALEQAAAILIDAGGRCFSLNAGGDALTRGRPAGTDGWHVGIQHPWERDRVAAVVLLVDAAVATSGRYERGDHIFDPRTGGAAQNCASVTVVGPDLGIADAYATAAMVLGPEGGARWLTTRVGYEGFVISATGSVTLTPGFGCYRAS